MLPLEEVTLYISERLFFDGFERKCRVSLIKLQKKHNKLHYLFLQLIQIT